MTDARTRMDFGQAEREHVRQALRRYMRENAIGTPKLRARIIDADQPRHREIPLSTLQRFLTGSHQTSEHHVALCHQFVKELPYFSEAHDIARFGTSLLTFLSNLPAAENNAASPAAPTIDFAGEYETRTRPRTAGEPWPYPPESNLIASHVTLAVAPGNSHVEAQETVFDLMNKEWAPQRRHAYEGALAVVSPFLHIVLRHCLTRQPKFYTLAKSPFGGSEATVLEGEGFDTVFLREDYLRRPLRENFRVQFVPRRPQEANP
jgi:hypothetical protein